MVNEKLSYLGRNESEIGTKPFRVAGDLVMKPKSISCRQSRIDLKRFGVREEFTSYAFLAVACAGVCLLSAGLVALVLT